MKKILFTYALSMMGIIGSIFLSVYIKDSHPEISGAQNVIICVAVQFSALLLNIVPHIKYYNK